MVLRFLATLLLLNFRRYPAFRAEVNIAGFFPFKNVAATTSGFQNTASFLMAVKEINDKTDGIYDELLPNTTLKYVVQDSDGTAFDSILDAIELEMHDFNSSGIVACIGASTNTESNALAHIFNAFKTVQISYSSTASFLSYQVPFPYFYRTCTSEAAQGLAMADMIYNHFGWRKVVIFSTTDSYGSDGSYVFKNAATSLGIDILSSYAFQSGLVDLRDIIYIAKDVGARIFILFMSCSDATRLIEQGHAAGLFYPGTQILGSSFMTVSSTWENMSKSVDLDAIMSGYIGFIPAFGLNITYTQSFVNRWRAQKDTKIVLSDGTIVCDTSVDDLGNKIYSNNNKCSGLTFSSFAKDGSDIASYVPHTYDATYALAHALHTLIYDMGISTFTGDELGEALQFNTSFQGEIGLVSFRYGDPATGYGFGDRLHDFSFNVMNYRKSSSSSSSSSSSGGSLQSVGLWTEGKGFQQCSSQTCLIEFSTIDGTIPIDTPLPVIDLMPLVVRIVLVIMSVICLAVVVGFTVFIVIHRTKKLIKAAQPKILMFTLFGGLLGCFRVGVAAFDDSDTTCISGIWLGHLAFVLVMTSLLAKLWRISRVVRSGFKRVVVGESYIIKAILLVVSIACVYLVLFTAIGQPHVVDDIVYLSQQRTKIRHKCTMKHSQFALALYICECLSLVYAWYLCWATKNVPDGINEAKHIALSTYIIIFICIIVFPATLFLSLSPIFDNVIVALGFAIAVCSCMIILLGYRTFLILEGADLNANLRLVKVNSSGVESVMSASSGGASSKYEEGNSSDGRSLEELSKNEHEAGSGRNHKYMNSGFRGISLFRGTRKQQLLSLKDAIEKKLEAYNEELLLLESSEMQTYSKAGSFSLRRSVRSLSASSLLGLSFHGASSHTKINPNDNNTNGNNSGYGNGENSASRMIGYNSRVSNDNWTENGKTTKIAFDQNNNDYESSTSNNNKIMKGDNTTTTIKLSNSKTIEESISTSISTSIRNCSTMRSDKNNGLQTLREEKISDFEHNCKNSEWEAS